MATKPRTETSGVNSQETRLCYVITMISTFGLIITSLYAVFSLNSNYKEIKDLRSSLQMEIREKEYYKVAYESKLQLVEDVLMGVKELKPGQDEYQWFDNNRVSTCQCENWK